ncbi:hypothetical protein [Colwellia sp. Arc7-D]|uniref:hypothetical protein n=1 Tax=Colwellia sp. Arc7-D TaxID=2161872 RepID=UPI000D383FFA|nr:hypothetical protein [Colwellia sp. Arc7-D]AWB58525.1 hypothetical protein DBO93_13815 [Colwellia sp. Arc7-D]
MKVDSAGDVVTAFADNGLRCTTENKVLTINDAVDIVLPIDQSDEFTTIETVVAVGKVKG